MRADGTLQGCDGVKPNCFSTEKLDGPDEDIENYMPRLRRNIKHLKIVHSFRDCDCFAYRLIANWAGHIARMRLYDPERETFRILQHKSWFCIQSEAQANGGSQLHSRRLHVWRWEAPLYEFFSETSWQHIAQDSAY